MSFILDLLSWFPRVTHLNSVDRQSNSSITPFEREVKEGERFTFGKNWAQFLSTLTDERIREAEKSLQEMLDLPSLQGLRFLDVGSGSGLFSLAAKRLGARVHSLDYDPQSVACAMRLKERFFPMDSEWTIEQGSALDAGYISSLGPFDVVYSWGVLHHTGEMWKALDLVGTPVKKGGKLFIALYNDQGRISRFWWRVKKTYCANLIGRILVLVVFVPYFTLRAVLKSIVTGTNAWAEYKRKNRGMSLWYDWIDWLGGFPFEVASVATATKFFEERGFKLLKIKITNSLGNNEFVFVKE